MKKIITTIILALLTSPAFADFKFKEFFIGTVEKPVKKSYVDSRSIDGKLDFSMTAGLHVMLDPRSPSTMFSPEITKVSFKFNDDQPRVCDYLYKESITIIEDISCRKWLVNNLMDKEGTVRVQYFNEGGELVESTISLKGSFLSMSALLQSGES